MAYAVAALTFGLAYCKKPVVVTGVQYLLRAEYTDGANNLFGAIEVANSSSADQPLPGVYVFMNNKLLLGARIQKLSATDINSFDTPGYHIIGMYRDKFVVTVRKDRLDVRFKLVASYIRTNKDIGLFDLRNTKFLEYDKDGFMKDHSLCDLSEIRKLADTIREEGKYANAIRPYRIALGRYVKNDHVINQMFEALEFSERKEFCEEVKLIYLHPGIQDKFENEIGSHKRILIVSYGAGNGPQIVKEVILKKEQILFAVCSVCSSGFVASAYESSLRFYKKKGEKPPVELKNVALCQNMTVEACFVKLHFIPKYCQSKVKRDEMRRSVEWMEHSVSGELDSN